MCVLRENEKRLIHITHKQFHIHKILYVSLHITDYLIGLAFLGLLNWVLVCGLEWDKNGINKTLAPMGLRLFCQLLTSLKLPLIIFNTTI